MLDLVDVPLEFVREVACASSVAEAGNVEGGTAARHDGDVGGDAAGEGRCSIQKCQRLPKGQW